MIGEPLWKTKERLQRLVQQAYPELEFSSPDRVMEVDNHAVQNHTGSPTRFSQDVMSLGAYAAAQQQFDLTQPDRDQSANALPDFGMEGSIYDETRFKPRTAQPDPLAQSLQSNDPRSWMEAASVAAQTPLNTFTSLSTLSGVFGVPGSDVLEAGSLGRINAEELPGAVQFGADIFLAPDNFLGGAGAARGAATRGGRAAATGMLDDIGETAARTTLRSQPIGGGSPVSEVLKNVIPGQKIDDAIVQLYEGRVHTQGLAIKRDLDRGNNLLGALGIGKPAPRGRIVQRSPEMEELFKALHGEGGEVPLRLKPLMDDLQAQLAAETQATIDFDPNFVLRPDYFPRFWKAPKETRQGAAAIGAKPGFAKHRIDATFSEMLADGWEPKSWNPYEMLALRREAGALFREQTEMVRYLQDTGSAIKADGPIPEGFRVPRVGPAFEGKPRVVPSSEGGGLPGFAGFTDRWAVRDDIADTLENMYGVPVRLAVGGMNIMPAIDFVGQGTKRAKLFGSLFQQVDFATRTGWFTFGGAVDSLLRGHPIEAVQKVTRVPAEIGRLAYANASPARRRALRDQILSDAPIFKDRPGITYRGLAERGAFGGDVSIGVQRDLRDMLNGLDTPKGLPQAALGAASRRFGQVEQAMQNGLFDGVYPQAQLIIARNNVVPAIARHHPDWTDEQIMASAAQELQKMFSTLGHSQTIFNNRGMRALTRNLIFSTNEPEALIKQALSTVKGPNKRLWMENWIGGVLFLAGVANAIHFAATGEPLPLDRYKPITPSGFGPLPIGYNRDFMSPNIPGMEGRGGTELTLDLMGQMDTIFRVLDPASFVTSRFSTTGRAVINQAMGEDFFGRPLDDPKERIAQAVSDLFAPIGVGNVLGAVGIGPENEGRLGTAGQLIQSAGPNVRAETNPQLKDRKAREQFGKSWEELTPRERLEVEEANPDLVAELEQRRAEGAAQGRQSDIRAERAAEVQKEIEEKQSVLDQQLEDDPGFAPQWREKTGELQRELGIRKDEIYADVDFGEGNWPILDQYFKVLDEAELPGGDIDFDKVDAWRATLTPEQDKFIDDNTGLKLSPKAREWREDRRTIEDAGYWDVRDQVFKYFLEAQGMAPDSWQFDDYWTEVRKQYRAYAVEYLDQVNPNWRETSPQADVLLANAEADRLRGKFDQGLGEARKQWLSGHLDIYELLTKWGYRTPGREEALNYAGVGQ